MTACGTARLGELTRAARRLVGKFYACRTSIPPVGQKLSAHGQAYAVAPGIGDTLHLHVEIDRAHDPVAELFFDECFPGRSIHVYEFVETIDERIGRRTGRQ